MLTSCVVLPDRHPVFTRLTCSETQVRFGDVSAINLAKIKRVLDISSKENVSNYILNRQVLSSLIYPASVLIEDVEINKSEPKKEKEPVLKFPLQR